MLTDPTGELIPVLIGIGAGYLFDYALEQYQKEHCVCQEADTLAGPVGNAIAGGLLGGSGTFASKSRGGVAGGGRSGPLTSTFSQMNHAMARRGYYSPGTRGLITSGLRKVPYVGTALLAYELYDVTSCD